MIVDTNLTARMRDGVLLRADAYRPGTEGRGPAILVRTPYGKDGHRDRPFVAAAIARGYSVVVQDVRGRCASDGDFDPYRQEARDGFDSVEWLAAQTFCDGRVAASGLSYPGAVQWLAAVEAPPHLVCIFPAMCFASARQFIYFGGAFDLSWLPWIAVNIAPDARRRHGLAGPRTPAEARAQWRRMAARAYRHVPLRDLPDFREVAPFLYEWLDHPEDGTYWQFADIEAQHHRVRVPAFNFSGWHDEGYGPAGAIRNFVGMRARGATAAARDPRLVLGPWTHGEPTAGSTRVGDVDFGVQAGLDYDRLVLDWCDLHVRGVDRGLADAPRVRVFVMGRNRWRESNEWPLPGTRMRPLFLRSGGRLAWTAAGPRSGGSPGRDGATSFRYDPNAPVQDPHFDDGLGPHDQQPLATRPDVLVFTSEPLPEDLEVIGRIDCRIWLSSTALDTDLVVRVLDVDPSGRAWNLMSPTLEVLRVRYRDGETEPRLLTPGVPVEVQLPLPVTGNVFRRGHRIGVHVTSSFFPHVDRNPNTGRPVPVETRLVPAVNTVHHDAERPSRILLPVLDA